MKVFSRILLSALLSCIIVACSTTKHIPDGQYLLDNVSINTDTKIKGGDDLETYIKQVPNADMPLFGKVGLKIYSLSGQDTAKFINRMIRKVGSKPIIYNPRLAKNSASQLELAIKNLGYLNASVDTTLTLKDKKAQVKYNIKAGTPYTIRNYTTTIEDTTIAQLQKYIAGSSSIKEGDLFNMDKLDAEQTELNNLLRNVGYYSFSKDFVYFKADTTLNSHQVDLYLNVYPAKDSLPHPRYKINNVTVVSGYRMSESAGRGRLFADQDTIQYKGMSIIKGRNTFLRNSTIYRNIYLRKGMYYSDRLLSWTYENFNSMGAVQQTNILLTPAPNNNDSIHLLDATVMLTPANPHWFRASLDGTNKAGDIGIAPSLSYQHQNLFKGGEVWNISLKGAYEFITGDKSTDMLNDNYYEYGAETSITFPKLMFPWLRRKWKELPSTSTKLSLSINNQKRTQYTRQFFSGSIEYGWATKWGRLRHSFSPLDITYVSMPWKSDEFEKKYLNDSTSNQLLKISYADQLIARSTYSFAYTIGQRFSKLPTTTTLRGSFEVAGWLPRIVAKAGKAETNEDGDKKILGVMYSEYVKGSLDFSQTIPINQRHTIAYHIGLGMAYPYGNSEAVPFEQSFFAGGANSIRGWSTRALGPGSYRSTNINRSDFVNRIGDIKFETSVESRHKVGDMFEVAAFLDAGNIWTLYEYEQQPNGNFRFDRFYKEIAVAYGIGLRLNLGFLLVRFDTGLRIFDPTEEKISDRFVMLKPRMSRTAFHFGIGYPF